MDKAGTTQLTEDQKIKLAIDYQKIAEQKMLIAAHAEAKEYFVAASEFLLSVAKTSKNPSLIKGLSAKILFLLDNVLKVKARTK